MEEQLHHGGKREHRLMTKIKRALRPKHHKLGMASAPFDWTAGVEHNCKIKDQGQSESCGGQAGARWLEIAEDTPEQSAKAIYSQGYYPPTGGMAKTTLESIISTGITQLEVIVPSYDASGNPLSESMYRDMSWKTDSLIRPLADLIPVTVNIDKESIAQAIRDTGSVLMLIEGQNGNPASWVSICPQPPLKSNPSAIWAHYMCITGAKNSYPKPIRADQSWGTSYGDNGRQYFGDDYLQSGYITDCFTFVRRQTMQDPRIPILQQLLKLYQQLLINLTAHSSS